MIDTLKTCKATTLLMVVWVVLFAFSNPFALVPRFAGNGFDIIGLEYYRMFTGPLLHFNIIHLIANVIGLYFVGFFVERSIGSLRFLLFGLVAATLSEVLCAFIMPTSDTRIGGSTWVFAFIGLIVALQLFSPDFPRFRLGTWYGNWILGYAILGNVPFMSFMGVGTVVTHLCALVAGAVLGGVGIWMKLL